MFKAAAAAETVHAHSHLDELGGVKSTLENLKTAFSGEHYEFTKMYPAFLEKAKEENHRGARKSFHWANEVEKVHGKLYENAIQTLESGSDLPDVDYYVCDRCGYTIAEVTPDKCPVCGAKSESFFKVD